MNYKKMRGKSVSECVTRIRKDYGESAIIIEHREVAEGGVLGSGLFSKKIYEVDFMIPERESIQSGLHRPRHGSSRSLLESVSSKESLEKKKPAREERLSDLKSTLKKLRDERSQELQTLKSESTASFKDGLPVSQEASPVASRKEEELTKDEQREEASALSALMTDVSFTREEMKALMEIEDTSTLPAKSTPPKAPPLKDESETDRKLPLRVSPDRSVRVMGQLREALLSARMSPEFAGHFLEELEENLTPAERKEYRSVESKSIDRLASMIRTVPDIAPPRGECRAVMLVGPTGSGKTTTLAKLAARYQIYQKREVSIYSLDHYRLAATEQLKFYASVLDVPFHSPLTPEAFQEDMRRDGAELMLIDTSGIGYRDSKKIEELKRFVDACEVRLEIHLTIPGGMDPAVIEKNLLAYDHLGFDKILITKLDETEFVGALIEHADKFNRPFSFITNGQEVPGDIMEAGSLSMAKLVFDGL